MTWALRSVSTQTSKSLRRSMPSGGGGIGALLSELQDVLPVGARGGQDAAGVGAAAPDAQDPFQEAPHDGLPHGVAGGEERGPRDGDAQEGPAVVDDARALPDHAVHAGQRGG